MTVDPTIAGWLVDLASVAARPDRELRERLQAIDHLPEAERATVKAVLDSFILKQRF